MEIWKDIPGYENLYEASNLGRVRTCEGKITSNARYPIRKWKSRILKFKTSTNKYGRKDYRVSLWKNGSHKDLLVSRIIAMTFVPGFFEGATVNHIDGDSLNNKKENLEWVTRAENIRHAFKTGLCSHCKQIRLYDENGFYMDFNSYSASDRYLNRPVGYISGEIKKSKKYCHSKDGEYFRIELF